MRQGMISWPEARHSEALISSGPRASRALIKLMSARDARGPEEPELGSQWLYKLSGTHFLVDHTSMSAAYGGVNSAAGSALPVMIARRASTQENTAPGRDRFVFDGRRRGCLHP